MDNTLVKTIKIPDEAFSHHREGRILRRLTYKVGNAKQKPISDPLKNSNSFGELLVNSIDTVMKTQSNNAKKTKVFKFSQLVNHYYFGHE